jgi:hypothetical protein
MTDSVLPSELGGDHPRETSEEDPRRNAGRMMACVVLGDVDLWRRHLLPPESFGRDGDPEANG